MTDEELSRNKSESNEFSLNSSFEFGLDNLGDSFYLLGPIENANQNQMKDSENHSVVSSEDISFTGETLLEVCSCLFCNSKHASFEKYLPHVCK